MTPVLCPPLLVHFDGHSPIALAATAGPFAAAFLVALVLLAWRPPVTRTAVLAIVPWALTAAGLHGYATVSAYPPAVRPLFDVPQVYLATFAVGGIAWIATWEFGSARRPVRDPSYHLVAMGAGTASVLVVGTAANASTLGLDRLVLLPIAVIAAIGVAGAVYLAFGILYTDAPAYTGLAGGLVVFAHALDGIATALGVSAFPWIGHTRLSSAAIELADAIPLEAHLGVNQLHEWVWILLWLKLAFAILVVAALAGYARDRPSRANVALGGIAAAGVLPGATTLLLVLAGG